MFSRQAGQLFVHFIPGRINQTGADCRYHAMRGFCMSQTGPENPSCQLPGANRTGGAEPQTLEPGSSPEKRRHPRLYAALPLKCQLSRPESAQAWEVAGTLKNISFGGVYFTCDDPLPLELGQIRNFSLNSATPGDQGRRPWRLNARGRVVRVERPAPDQGAPGIAVQFLTPLQLSPA
jgi:hypothetical protein